MCVSSWTSFCVLASSSLVKPRTGYHGPQPLPLACLCVDAAAMPFRPENLEESERAARRLGTHLNQDRILRPQTRSRRETLLADFDRWLFENAAQSLDSILEGPHVDAEHVSELLVAYGRQMYESGKFDGRFSETINAVTSRKPFLRRSLITAWDLAFSWVTEEPHIHHAAMPLSVVLAFSGLNLLWGWPTEAAIILMTWCGILRIGEVFPARRAELVLPCDAAPGVSYALLQIRQPKTRGSQARHQAARVDPADVVALLTAVFGGKSRDEKRWLLSPSTMRKRFNQIQRALGLPTTKVGRQVPYDLASLRAGGATFLLQRYEDSELVRRRGRWLSAKVCEIYLQETAVATYAEAMPPVAFRRIQDLSSSFPDILEKALFFLDCHIPPNAWTKLW